MSLDIIIVYVFPEIVVCFLRVNHMVNSTCVRLGSDFEEAIFERWSLVGIRLGCVWPSALARCIGISAVCQSTLLHRWPGATNHVDCLAWSAVLEGVPLLDLPAKGSDGCLRTRKKHHNWNAKCRNGWLQLNATQQSYTRDKNTQLHAFEIVRYCCANSDLI